jgi:hypothetical protein
MAFVVALALTPPLLPAQDKPTDSTKTEKKAKNSKKYKADKPGSEGGKETKKKKADKPGSDGGKETKE